MNQNNDLFWPAVIAGVAASVVFFFVGVWVGASITVTPQEPPTHRIIIERQCLTEDMLKSIENDTAKDYFSKQGRDPFKPK